MIGPRALLICTEGKTEAEYFRAITAIYGTLPYGTELRILEQLGQHETLIRRAAAERKRLADELETSIGNIEAWAVCDDDGMARSFAELLAYAETRGVHLAFSRPQFESFLLQHFEPSRVTDRHELFARLTLYRGRYDFYGSYDDSKKADLRWMRDALTAKPRLIDAAIANANLRRNPAGNVFLTVQDLVVRVKELESPTGDR